jgi:hypothetical protein
LRSGKSVGISDLIEAVVNRTAELRMLFTARRSYLLCLLLLLPFLAETGRSFAAEPPGGVDGSTPTDPSAVSAQSSPSGGSEASSSPDLSREAGELLLGPVVWGFTGLRGFAFGQQVAPNGLEFNPLFSMDLDLNLWLWREGRVYAFADTRFWAQRAGQGVTNSNQGIFDFSKREFDLDFGAAWNYFDKLEARVFAYSMNNLNRGSSDARPTGYNDGVGIENRFYIGPVYNDLGLVGFDVSRAGFLSLGYYPTKDMVDCDGNIFKPGPFARAYLTYDLIEGGLWYLYLDAQIIGTRDFRAKLFEIDGGTAIRPLKRAPFLEFRLGSADNFDLRNSETETSLYLAVRFNF